ncbi:glycosyltransferase family 4 protein [Nostoc spongiaeforme FACHB-130]|uniref:Glycosyltransferase family 4 protein n=1 Tax=Nostoc spongiaeforme FACHB-130 TaxID=1357510 RepID=A0ABR8G593_9NOSO|nr:glycosyltransferase family 1 protein [Nostoc spongiaeforme]MBD2598342.1 glycosyltransferase family 4 protein [Nostoc spongiaeforme FACHB-130]
MSVSPRIAIDLTPLLPDGKNGGAKILVLTLLKKIQQLVPNYEFLLLTAPWNHQELAEYETENTQRILLTELVSDSSSKLNIQKIKDLCKRIKFKLARLTYLRNFLASHKIDLLFCPFSAPRFAENGIPVVAIVYDTQHLDYPEFFELREQQLRTNFLKNLLQKSQKVICISEFCRQSLIKHFQASAEQLTVIPVSIQDRWHGLSEELVNQYLLELGLVNRCYAFYPANYWPHKNHRLLLEAYKIFKLKFANFPLDLVFTGDLKQEENQLRQEVTSANLDDCVHFLGFLDEKHLEAVWRGCKCLVFPSLYEGFGIPVLEAMYFGKPILCSSAGSLPEVGGDAVLYFNPNNPEDLVNCLLRISYDADLVDELVCKGKERLKLFDGQEMAEKYIDIFKDAASKKLFPSS